MRQQQRFEFKNSAQASGWINTSGASHLPNSTDIFVRPTVWGLFTWNKENSYPIESAVSLHREDVEQTHGQGKFVCRPVTFE
jgi:hypothetical protein